MALPSIPALEALVAQLIALILLVLAGARLILDGWHALLRSKTDHVGFSEPTQQASCSPDYGRKANPEAQLRPTRRPRVADPSGGSAGILNRRKKPPPGGKRVA